MSRDRDRILEQALKPELSAAGTPPAGACLDAETLGAWVDGGLDPAAMASTEVHVANCARCQALAGTFARSTPVVEATEARGLPLWKWWLAPIAAGVTAVTLWTVIPEQQQIAEAPPQAKAADAVQPSVATEAVPPAAQSPAATAAGFGARENLAAASRGDRQREENKEERKQDAPARAQERAALADAAVPPPPAVAQLGAVAAPAPAERVTTLQKRVGQEIALFEIPTLQPSVRWRMVGDFFLELTENGGASWDRRHQIPGVHTGSAPSSSVLWLAGVNGTVWLTTDGAATFRQIGLAEPLDIASVSATDARTASVFTVSGRRFRTEDAGRTWRPF